MTIKDIMRSIGTAMHLIEIELENEERPKSHKSKLNKIHRRLEVSWEELDKIK